MSWPTPLDYQEAVQNPQVSFSYPGLRGSEPERNKLGLPLVSSGNFASVFKLKNRSGDFAVRCFLRPVTDHQRRYNLLSHHLKAFSSPHLVRFKYVPDGIRVRGQWFPIVIMDWVEGETLDNFVQQHLNDSDALGELAAKWRGLVSGLRGAFMAHGDLQHGNVLVDNNGRMYLVDYDDMFIASFSGEKSPELGHPNYQHPQRSADNYDGSIDHFATLVIYLSLRALVVDPGLWGDFNTGDNLILTRAHYLDARQSLCIRRLKSSRDPVVAKLANLLEKCCPKSITSVPYLETELQGIDDSESPPLPPPQKKPGRKKTKVQDQMIKAEKRKLECPNCGRKHDTHIVYCQKCLAVLAGLNKCAKCQHSIPANAPYCPDCGAQQTP